MNRVCPSQPAPIANAWIRRVISTEPGLRRRLHRRVRHGLILAVCASAAACAAAASGAGSSRGPAMPVIDAISPPSGLAGPAYPIEIVLTGSGFSEVNVVRFGSVVIPGIPSTDGGTRIVFMAPKVGQAVGEAPPMVLQPGRYPVTVTTEAGTSRAIEFELTRV